MDKWLIGMPAGGITFSLAFHEKISGKSESADYGLLLWAWIAFATGLIFGFCSLYASHQALDKQVKILDEEQDEFISTTTPDKPEGDKKKDGYKNLWNCAVKVCNVISVVATIAGIVFLLTFANRATDGLMSDNAGKKAKGGHVPSGTEKPKPPTRPLPQQEGRGYVPPTNEPKPKPPKK